MRGRRRNGADPLAAQTRILGIDPGLGGGWAVVTGSGRLFSCGCLPLTADPSKPDRKIIDTRMLSQLIAMSEPTIAVVEAVSSRPRQSGAFTFGMGVGMVLGTLTVCGVPYRQVSPAAWKATYGLRASALPETDETPGGKRAYRQMKEEARRVASSLYPDWEDAFAKVKDDGVAEAVLIALHGLATPSLSNFTAAINGAAEPH